MMLPSDTDMILTGPRLSCIVIASQQGHQVFNEFVAFVDVLQFRAELEALGAL